jgi:hypothetical protein
MKINSCLAYVTGICFASILFLSSMTLHAQSNNPGPKIGIKGGFNLSQFFIDQPQVEDENSKLGLHFGIFSKVPLTNLIAFQPELLYTNTGSKVSYGGTNLENALGISEGQVRFNLNYIQLPLALAVNLGPLNIHAGPYFSYLLSANVKNLRSSDLANPSTIELDKDNFNSLDFGLLGGIGFDVQNVTIGVRYNYGLREIGKEGIAKTITNGSRNGVAQLYLGIGF